MQVSKDYADLRQLYIHCKLGLCTSDPTKAQGNLKLVRDSFANDNDDEMMMK